MRKVERISRFQMFFHERPDGPLGRVRNEIFDNSAPLAGLVQVKQGFPRHPSVLPRPVPVRLELPGLPDDDLKTVVFHIQRLRRALDAVSDHRDRLVLEHLASLRHGKFFSCYDFFLNTAKVDDRHVNFLSSQ